MAKVIKFRPATLRREPVQTRREGPRVCGQCGHKTNIHIRHPDGVVSCAARGCGCESQPS